MDGLMDGEGVLDSYEVASALRYSGRWKSAQVRGKTAMCLLRRNNPHSTTYISSLPLQHQRVGRFLWLFWGKYS